MGDRKLVEYVDSFTDKEIDIMQSILTEYSLKMIDGEKNDGHYIINTNKGYVCLKKIKSNKKKPLNGNKFSKELLKNDFINIAKYFETKDGYLFIKHRKSFFYVIEWIDGEECDLNNIQEACECVKLLAKFHLASSNIDCKKLKLKNNLKNWPKIFANNLSDLEKLKKIIHKKKINTEFDKLYENFIDSAYKKGVASLHLLNKSDYYSLSQEATKNKSICLNNFYGENIVKVENQYYLMNLNNIIKDLRIRDIGKFIRRLMYKKEYQWDFKKAEMIIESYNDISKLSKAEIQAMLCVILFPRKFCKLGKRKYLKHKKWSESKYIRKLNKLIKHDDLQRDFLREYITYANNYQ